MIYSLNLLMCAIGVLLFKDILSFMLITFAIVLLYYVFIRKLSDITKVLFFLNILTIFIGGLVIWLLPNRDGVIPSIIINAYYLGPLEFILFIAFLVSAIYDIKNIIIEKNKKKKELEKEKKKELSKTKNIEFKEKVEKLEKTINDSNEKIKKIVEDKKEEKPKKKTTPKKTTKKVVKTKKTEKKEKK